MAGTNTIRTKLIHVVLTLVIPGWIAMAGVIFSFYQQERAHIIQNTIGISRALMAAVDRELVSTIAAAQVLAASPSLASDDLSRFHNEASALVPLGIGNNFVITDASGQQLLNTLRPYGEPLPTLPGNADLRREMFASGKPSVGDLFVGPITKTPLVRIQVPVFRGGEIKYALGVGLALESFSEILQGQRLPPKWIAVILDKSGVIVARTHSPERFVGQKAASTALKAMSESRDGTVDFVSREGIPAIAAFSQSEISKWGVSIGIPVAELPLVSNSYLLASGMGALVLLLIGFGFASYQSSQIARAISGLIPPAVALGLGKAPKFPRLGIREADDVAQALDRTYHLLRRRTAERDEALRNEVESQITTKIQDEFVATVSHELRTPLTSIAGALGLLSGGAAGPLPSAASRLVSIAHTNVLRLLRLINDILDIAKFESGDMAFTFEPVDVRVTIEQAIEANLSFAQEHQVRIRLEQGNTRCAVWGDNDRLNQVITNLLSNAIKFSPPGQEVVVAIDRREKCGRITVRDHGPGISAAFKPNLFDKFSQADSGNARQKGGSGLGLHIVRNIMAQHNGIVGVEDAPGGGSIFYIDIPLWNDAEVPKMSAALV